MAQIDALFDRLLELKGSDLHLGVDTPPMGRVRGVLMPLRERELSRRELEVVRLVAAGRTSHEIAAELFISTRTAEHHIANIYTKIGVSNRAAATRWAIANGIGDA